MSSVFSDVDEYGFKRHSRFNYEQYEKFMSSYFGVLANRSKKWHDYLNGGKPLKPGSKLKRYVQKGIPLAYRPQVWMTISGVDDLKDKHGHDFYHKCFRKPLDAGVVQAIRSDLPRTFPDNIFFVNQDGLQEQLYKILHSYASDNSAVGYCQGFNYIAGLLLLVTKSEDASFWLLKVIVEQKVPKYYVPDMAGLVTDIEVFSKLVKVKMPDLHAHVKSIGVPWSCLVMKWFVCLYIETLPTETVLRIWDCLFYQRSKILFHVGLTLINYHREALILCDTFVSFCDYFRAMKYDFFVLDCHAFMKKVTEENKSITNKDIDKLRKIVQQKNKKSPER